MVGQQHRARVVVCDDEQAARRGAIRALSAEQYELVECVDGQHCLDEVAAHRPDLVLLDLRMPVMDGRAVLERLAAMPDPPPVVVLTADASMATAIEAVQRGAGDYLAKPYEIAELRFVVGKVLERERLRRENQRLEQEVRSLRGGVPPGVLLGSSAAMQAVKRTIEEVASSSAPVMIRGETGTGKELAARQLHALSPVAGGPFVSVNCAAIPETLVESELFGARRGAFTGADRDRVGRIVEADGGTLLLDEIGDMPPPVQAKLLRVLQDGVVEPLGGGAVTVSVRWLAATHRDLGRMVEEQEFRQDLLYRLRVVELEMPPLRQRGDDVLELAEHFLSELVPRTVRVTPRAAQALRSYPWPGNVRELRNAVERAAIFSRGGLVQLTDLPREIREQEQTSGAGSADPFALSEGESLTDAKQRVVARLEHEVITQALRQHAGNVSRAARQLGMHRQSLQQKLRQLGIDASRVIGSSTASDEHQGSG